MRKYITLIMLIVVGILSLWLQEDSQIKTEVGTPSDTHFPDYFMENFTITNMNEQGQPGYIVKAKKMLHYADDESAELEQPFITFSEAGKKMTLQASRAVFSPDENTVILFDNVIIHRDKSKTQNELSIYTDYLKINTQSRIAETDKEARVKTADAELNTIGLTFDSIQGNLKLKSQVKGVYDVRH